MIHSIVFTIQILSFNSVVLLVFPQFHSLHQVIVLFSFTILVYLFTIVHLLILIMLFCLLFSFLHPHRQLHTKFVFCCSNHHICNLQCILYLNENTRNIFSSNLTYSICILYQILLVLYLILKCTVQVRKNLYFFVISHLKHCVLLHFQVGLNSFCIYSPSHILVQLRNNHNTFLDILIQYNCKLMYLLQKATIYWGQARQAFIIYLRHFINFKLYSN